MMTSNFIPMGLLSIQGESAKQLLQGQFTCNLDDMTAEGILGAHCNPQGRIIHLFRLFKTDEGYLLYLPTSMLPIALQAIQKYAVFFKVTISDVSAELNTDTTLAPSTADSRAWIEAGVPMIYPETSEQFLPHDINLPLLNGVSFNKGCYTGQEIIARMHYRAKLKKHMQIYKSEIPFAVKRGQAVFSDKGDAGYLVDFCLFEKGLECLIITPKDPDTLYLDTELTIALTPLALPYDLE